MPSQTTKIVRKRRLDTPRAKRQQRDRRRDTLFKKCCEYSLECHADVYISIRIRKDGRIFTFNSDSGGEWPISEAQMVRCDLKSLFGFKILMENRTNTIHSLSESRRKTLKITLFRARRITLFEGVNRKEFHTLYPLQVLLSCV